jgi:glycine betaine transporter
MKTTTSLQADNQPLGLVASKKDIDWPLFLISGGFLGAFLIAALVDIDGMSNLVNTLFAWSTKFFGLYWQILMLLTFAVSLFICFSKCGRVRLGGVDQRPDTSTFNWIAVIMCALLAGGGAFWAAAEPMMHFASPPPLFAGVQPHTEAAAHVALAQSFVHWGFLAWAVLGSLLSIVLMHLHYDKGLPLAPRTLLYPLLGKRCHTAGTDGDQHDRGKPHTDGPKRSQPFFRFVIARHGHRYSERHGIAIGGDRDEAQKQKQRGDQPTQREVLSDPQ